MIWQGQIRLYECAQSDGCDCSLSVDARIVLRVKLVVVGVPPGFARKGAEKLFLERKLFGLVLVTELTQTDLTR